MQSPEHLGMEHLQPLRRALINFLSAPISEFTYAQIIDGQPTSDVYAADYYFREGLAVSDHKVLCPGSLEKARAFRSDFNVLNLAFDPNTLQAYQETSPGSIAWKIRLLELVASVCHDIAVHLYQMDAGVHKHREHEEWLSEKLASLPEKSLDRKVLPPPTLFWNGRYIEWSRYPSGLADIVGYWAETQIFGGVVLFDRGESEEECNGIYLHSGRGGRTGITIAPPTKEQFDGLVHYLLSPTPDHNHCPFPIEITPDNRWRWHPYDGRVKHHIWRNRHEIPEGPRPRAKDVINAYDWPERIEEINIRRELAKKEAGEPFDEAFLTAAMETNRQITPTSRLWAYHEKEIMELEPDRKRQGRPSYFFDP
ncbi:hypothetical protein F5883DRAFT_412019 [Diaporthe sp. PMI_573]|nr:hypothetical protein F5883DRAFT_412019 [Diaporthaceae sp. PMI_573]